VVGVAAIGDPATVDLGICDSRHISLPLPTNCYLTISVRWIVACRSVLCGRPEWSVPPWRRSPRPVELTRRMAGPLGVECPMWSVSAALGHGLPRTSSLGAVDARRLCRMRVLRDRGLFTFARQCGSTSRQTCASAPSRAGRAGRHPLEECAEKIKTGLPPPASTPDPGHRRRRPRQGLLRHGTAGVAAARGTGVCTCTVTRRDDALTCANGSAPAAVARRRTRDIGHLTDVSHV
jgi:hypothetical protein